MKILMELEHPVSMPMLAGLVLGGVIAFPHGDVYIRRVADKVVIFVPELDSERCGSHLWLHKGPDGRVCLFLMTPAGSATRPCLSAVGSDS